MTVSEAISIILGPDLAHDITMSQGEHWAVVAAVASATTDMDPDAISTLRDHIAKRRPTPFHMVLP